MTVLSALFPLCFYYGISRFTNALTPPLLSLFYKPERLKVEAASRKEYERYFTPA